MAYIASGYRTARFASLVIIPDWFDQTFLITVIRLKTLVCFHNVPAIVSTIFYNIYFLNFVLSYVACPKRAGGAVEAEPPGISHTVSKDLFTKSIFIPFKRIVSRNAI